MKVKKSTFSRISILLYTLYFYYNQQIAALINYRFSVMLLLAAVLFAFAGNSTLNKRIKVFLTMWILLIFLYLFNNRAIVHGNTTYALIYLFYFLGGLLLSNSQVDTAEFACKGLAYTGIIHCISTIIFFLFPALYTPMPEILGVTPTWGIGVGIEYGYRAGITTHYSSNGIYCSIEVICLFTLLMNYGKKAKRKYIALMTILAVISLLLTAKRGHLVFTLCSLLMMWYFCSPGKKMNRLFKIVFSAVLIVSALLILAQFVPVIDGVISRFTDSEDISSGRFLIWARAFDAFKEHPFIGVGWWGFFYDVLNQTTYFGASNSHNVYIQLLCETGCIGFIIMLIFFFIHLRKTIEFAQCGEKGQNNNISMIISTSLALQLFFLLYAFTGNDLYDFTVISYMLACVMTAIIHSRLGKCMKGEIKEWNW